MCGFPGHRSVGARGGCRLTWSGSARWRGRWGCPSGRLRQLADTGVIPATRTGGGHRRFDLGAVRESPVRHRMAGWPPIAVPHASGRPAFDRTYETAGLQEDVPGGRSRPAHRRRAVLHVQAGRRLQPGVRGCRVGRRRHPRGPGRRGERGGRRHAGPVRAGPGDAARAPTTSSGPTPSTSISSGRAPSSSSSGSGVRFVSRSEAKRLMRGLDRYREVVLDSRDVEQVGQGFVDEVFRVWPAQHPGTTVIPVSMVGPVEFMVRRGLPGLPPSRAAQPEPPRVSSGRSRRRACPPGCPRAAGACRIPHTGSRRSRCPAR